MSTSFDAETPGISGRNNAAARQTGKGRADDSRARIRDASPESTPRTTMHEDTFAPSNDWRTASNATSRSSEPMRSDFIASVRAQISAGRYDTVERLASAADSLLASL
jgi:hypothetical protein